MLAAGLRCGMRVGYSLGGVRQSSPTPSVRTTIHSKVACVNGGFAAHDRLSAIFALCRTGPNKGLLGASKPPSRLNKAILARPVRIVQPLRLSSWMSRERQRRIHRHQGRTLERGGRCACPDGRCLWLPVSACGRTGMTNREGEAPWRGRQTRIALRFIRATLPKRSTEDHRTGGNS
jgi:hypothetical protein